VLWGAGRLKPGSPRLGAPLWGDIMKPEISVLFMKQSLEMGFNLSPPRLHVTVFFITSVEDTVLLNNLVPNLGVSIHCFPFSIKPIFFPSSK
jgi:hypothetical protein